MEDAHFHDWEKVCAYFNTDPEVGLSDQGVEEKRKKYGPNG